MSSPSLQSMGRSNSQLYGATNGSLTTSLSSSRLNQLTLGQSSNSTSSLGPNRGISQQTGLTNGFLTHQTNQTSNINSKFSPGLGNSLSSSNFVNNSFGSNFGSNIMSILGSGGGSTSPSSGTGGATSFGGTSQPSSHLFGSQQQQQPLQQQQHQQQPQQSGGSSHIFGNSLSSNSNGPYSTQFSNLPNNTGYSSFNSGGFSPSLDLTNATSESLDLSEFPSLQPAATLPLPTKQLSGLRLDGIPGMSTNVPGFGMTTVASANGAFSKAAVPGNKTYSEVSNTNCQSKPENSPGFQISHEDFPALPGAPKPPHPISTQQTLPTEIMSQVTPSLQPEVVPASLPLPPSKPSATSIVLPTFPPSMCKDQFGMAGLLAFIRSKDSCPNLIKFALGMDLCDLGLNLQSKGNLHSTFQSPWADRPCGLHHLEQTVPQEYRRLSVRLNINMIERIKKYGDDLLFWLYYNNIGTTIQLMAIQELQNRGWMYYIPDKIWITKALGKEAPKGSYGVYCWFDVANWKKSEREINLEPDKIEYCEQSKAQFRL